MKKEIKSLLKKTAKIAGVTCVAAGAVAIMTSGVAVKAIGEGGKHLLNTVKKIAKEGDAAVTTAEASEEDFVEAESAVCEEPA